MKPDGPLCFSDILAAAHCRKKLMAFAFVSCAGGIFLSSKMMTPRYEASTMILAGTQNAFQGDTGSREASILRQDHFISSQVPIIQSESVVFPAIAEIGPVVLLPPEPDSVAARVTDHLEALGEKLTAWRPGLRPWIAMLRAPQDKDADVIAVSYLRVLQSLSVRAEPKTDIIRVSFRHRDPQVAARFANAVAARYIDRQVEITNNSSTLAFLQKQRSQLAIELEAATKSLSQYSRINGVYETKEQRELLLRQVWIQP